MSNNSSLAGTGDNRSAATQSGTTKSAQSVDGDKPLDEQKSAEKNKDNIKEEEGFMTPKIGLIFIGGIGGILLIYALFYRG